MAANSSSLSTRIEVSLEPGEGIVWETEPCPAGYEREVLRF